MSDHRYFIINKPYDMVSQFISADRVRLLGELDYDFPEGIHAIGRLDSHSEGLLILTTNKKITKLLFESDVPHKRCYLVRVRNIVSEETITALRKGISIRVMGGDYYTTAPCEAEIVHHPEKLFPVPAETGERGPHSWVLLTLTEGKYHQVRKMVAAVHHQCKRLIRISIEDLGLDGLEPGGVREIEEEEFFRKLKLAEAETTKQH